MTIVRSDIDPGHQVAQTAHAIAEFAGKFPEEFEQWKRESNSVVCLSCADEEELMSLIGKLEEKAVDYSAFAEPDMGDQTTAVSFLADRQLRKTFQHLSLALNTGRARSKAYESMIRCEQAPGVDMLDHGIAVFQKYKQLYKHLHGISTCDSAPSWMSRREEIIPALAPLDVVFDYTVHHDCGKPSCLTVGEDGKRRYPGHAVASEAVAASMGLRKAVRSLISKDMDFHTLKSEDIARFAADPDAVTLMVVAAAEVLANAEMFGGTDSDSFKIKWKHIEKRGRQVLDAIKQTKTQAQAA